MRKDIYRVIGNAFELLAYSSVHCNYNIYYIKNFVITPALLNNVYVYYNDSQHPVAYFSWATITSIVEANLIDDNFIMAKEDWNSGQRLYIHDLIAPWGGGDSIVKDIKNTLFPFVPYGFGIRRKKGRASRKSIFFTNKTRVRCPEAISDIMTRPFDNLDLVAFVLNEINSMLGEYELKYSLDVNDELNLISLKQAINIYNLVILMVNNKGSLKNLSPDDKNVVSSYFSNFKKNDELKSFSFHRVEKVQQPTVIYETNTGDYSLSVHELSCLYESYFRKYLKQLDYPYESLIEFTFIDLKYSCDKLGYPFCSLNNHTQQVYVYCPYHGRLHDILNYVHEISHALHYHSVLASTNFWGGQHSVIVNEILAMLHELFFINYLKHIKPKLYKALMKCIDSAERTITYNERSCMHSQAWYISHKIYHELQKLEHPEYVLCEMIKSGGKLTLDDLLKIICE